MRVLIVASGNANKLSPFVKDQALALEKQGIELCYFLIKGNGVKGYLSNYKSLIKKIKECKPNVVHAHYGLSGLLAILQRKVPVVTTFHGSDINDKKVRFFSKIASSFSRKSIFVSENLSKLLNVKNPIIIPCGVDFSIFKPLDTPTKKDFNLDLDKKYILFSSSFDREVKNYPLAKQVIAKFDPLKVGLIELKGYNREQVCSLMNVVECGLMTSFTEGSPQFIKEAMSCNLPVVTTNVGDVNTLLKGVDNSYITSYEVDDIYNKVALILESSNRSNAREKIKYLDNIKIANKLIEVYKSI